jgi:hypothetical protein
VANQLNPRRRPGGRGESRATYTWVAHQLNPGTQWRAGRSESEGLRVRQ